jgi:peptide/nickel transport system ATP-binding protein
VTSSSGNIAVIVIKRRELKAQQHERGFCILFITHGIHLARKVSDRVYVLDHGSLVEQGAAFELFGRPLDDRTRELPAAATERL